MSVLPKMYD
uniref:Uncharacterized protein n=1 Tax=Arundo donax TaxID=35708 RepID=A0A0A8YWD9_ARUDO